MKLIVAGVALIALSLFAPLAGLNPLYPALAGIVCGLIGAFRDAQPLPDASADASPGATADAAALSSYKFPKPDDHDIGPSVGVG
jgi:hypothetical protein